MKQAGASAALKAPRIQRVFEPSVAPEAVVGGLIRSIVQRLWEPLIGVQAYEYTLAGRNR
jgi:hypothetical protein